MRKWKQYLATEIGIEFKACLYFFVILFFYCMYRILQGEWDANILVMAEMIFTTYAMGYAQLIFMGNFDEAERLGLPGVFKSILGTSIYTGISYLFQWFDRNLTATVLFFLYILSAYLCAFLVYKIKREMDTKQLNEELEYFKNQEVYEKQDEHRK